MHIIIFLTKVLFLMKCNIDMRETYTVNFRKEIKPHLQSEVEVLSHNVPIYQCNFKEMSHLYSAVSTQNQSL